MKQEVAEEIVYNTERFSLYDDKESMLATQLNCFPIIDVIRNCQAGIGNVLQQIWTCKKCADNCAIIYCTDDQKRLLYMQNLTDIKIEKSSMQLIVKDGVVTFDIVHGLSRINDTAQLN